MHINQQRAMWARIKAAGGLRALIKKRKRSLKHIYSPSGKASQYETFFHATPQRNVDKIKRQGLIPGQGAGFFNYLSGENRTYLTKRFGAQRYGDFIHMQSAPVNNNPAPRNPHLVKVKIPKEMVAEDRIIPDPIMNVVEWRVRQPIPKKMIRSIKPHPFDPRGIEDRMRQAFMRKPRGRRV